MVLVRRKNRGFSLVEMLVAALLLSGGVVTLCAVSSKSMRNVKYSRQYELAWEVLDRQLTLIDYMGIEEFIKLGQMAGESGDDEKSGTVYYWMADVTEGDADNLYKVGITVYWGDKRREGKVSASTVFNGKGTLVLLGEAAEQK